MPRRLCRPRVSLVTGLAAFSEPTLTGRLYRIGLLGLTAAVMVMSVLTGPPGPPNGMLPIAGPATVGGVVQ